MNEFMPTERTRVRRMPKRASYDETLIYSILDEGLICHVGFVVDEQPYVIPTTYCRIDNTLYFHGAPASRMLRSLDKGIKVCITVTLLDALVVARSAFNNSVNYRSVVILGTASQVLDYEEKFRSLQALVEHIIPGRWDDIRTPTDKEVKSTLVLSLPLREVSAKVRTGPQTDNTEDYELPIWGGLLPLQLTALAPLSDQSVKDGFLIPSNLMNYHRPTNESKREKGEQQP